MSKAIKYDFNINKYVINYLQLSEQTVFILNHKFLLNNYAHTEPI